MSALLQLGVQDGATVLAPIGLIGGMSWRSTVLYYQRLNEAIDLRCSGSCNARVLVASLDYASLLRAAEAGRWDQVERVIVDAGKWLEQSGCAVIALTAVTAHLSHDALSKAVGVAVPHVLDASLAQLDELQIAKVGVLGTARTCGSKFIRDRLTAERKRDLLVVPSSLQVRMDRMIYERLSIARIAAEDRDFLLEAIDSLQRQGAEAVLLACTELPLLLPLPDVPDRQLILDSVALHVDAICELILRDRHS